jgi:hypothetical protein
MRRKLIFIIPAAIVGIVLFTFLGGEIVKSLWNWLMPSIFGLRQIVFWEALGILVLCRILFGGHGFSRGARSSMRGGEGHGLRRRFADRVSDRMADRMGERWTAMTPEERERFRQRVRERCGFDPADGDARNGEAK